MSDKHRYIFKLTGRGENYCTEFVVYWDDDYADEGGSMVGVQFPNFAKQVLSPWKEKIQSEVHTILTEQQTTGYVCIMGQDIVIEKVAKLKLTNGRFWRE